MFEEKFSHGSSLLHRADPKMKIIGFTFPALIIAGSSSIPALYAGLFFGLTLLFWANLPLREVAKLITGINFFILFLWIALLLSGGETILTHIGPLTIYKQGVDLAHRITLKANSITLLILCILTTSPVMNIGRGLEQLGFSPKFTLLLVSSFRYLGVIYQEYFKLRRAAELRCFKPSTTSHTYRTYSYLIGMTMVRSYIQAKRIYNAMILRGFSGTFPSMNQTNAKNSDYLLAALFIFVGLMLATLSII